MDELIVRDVDFNGATLKAAQDENGVVWAGVRWMCDGIGLSDEQRKRQARNIHSDIVLSKGVSNLILPTSRGSKSVLCLMLDYVPLWLAKISITPKMRRETPELVEKLIEYQLKAKDVLAAAFLKKEEPEVYSRQIMELQDTVNKLHKDMSTLANIILDWRDKSVDIPQLVNKTDEWKRSVYKKIDIVCSNSDIFMDRSDVLKYIYKYMNRTYGIVWPQEIIEYRKYNNISGRVSTIEAIASKGTLKSIFEAVLNDMVERHSKEVVVETKKLSWADETINPLVVKYGDKSSFGMATYRRVYRRMEENNRIGWKNLRARYVTEHGKTPSEKQLIETRPTLRKKFKIAVDQLLEE